MCDVKRTKLAKYGKGLKSIDNFFSPRSEVKGVGKGHPTETKTTELSTLEYKLVYVDGLSRAEARHVAMATMASLKEVSTTQQTPADEDQDALPSNQTSQHAWSGNDEDNHPDYPILLSIPACSKIPPHELEVLHEMWARGDVVVDGGPPFGVQLKHVDFERLLSPGIGVSGWLNDTIMDFIGKIVNTINPNCYVFTTFMRECFLMGKEKGRRAIRRVCEKVWKKVAEDGSSKTSVPEGWLFPLIRDGDPHWWLLYADVGAKYYNIIDPFSPNSAAPERRVQVAQELLSWVLTALFGKRITMDDMEYFPVYNYVLPAQEDGYNCGVFVGLYMAMLARNLINYKWPLDIDEYRWRLAIAFERNDPECFLESQHQP